MLRILALAASPAGSDTVHVAEVRADYQQIFKTAMDSGKYGWFASAAAGELYGCLTK